MATTYEHVLDEMCQHCGVVIEAAEGCTNCGVSAAEQNYQTRGGKKFHKGDFFYTPSDDPSTWKLLKSGTPGGAPDEEHVGAAAAALGKGFRGQKVQIPAKDLPGVKAKVRAAWRKLHPGKKKEDMPDGIKAAADEPDVLEMEAMSLEVPELDVPHPNRTPFYGVLTRVDEPSDKSPGGALGHKVLIPRTVAEAAIPSLLMMGVNVQTGLKGHERQNKVGVISEAWIDGNDLKVSGFLYARDFPQEVAELRRLSPTGMLGMSYEITDVDVANPNSPIWEVRSLVFTGAAILSRQSAAYSQTKLIAAQKEEGTPMEGTGTSAVALAASGMITSGLAASGAGDGGSFMLSGAQIMGGDDAMKMMYEMLNKMGAMATMMEDMDYMKGIMESISRNLEGLCKGMGGGMMGEADKKETTNVEATDKDKETQEEPTLQQVLAQVAELAKKVDAMGEMLTDKEETSKNLVTDGGEASRSGVLRTDAVQRPADGGPQRSTMTAQGDYEAQKAAEGTNGQSGTQFVEKFPGQSPVQAQYDPDLIQAGFQPGIAYTIEQVDKQLIDSGITDTMQKADLKTRLAERNQLP